MNDPIHIPVPPVLRGTGGAESEFTIECLVGKVVFTLRDDRPPQATIVLDPNRRELDENTGKQKMLPRLDAGGNNIYARDHRFEMHKGQRASFARQYLHGLFVTWCSLCGKANSLRGRICRRQDHRLAGHWQIIGGLVTPAQVRVVGEEFELGLELKAVLAEQARSAQLLNQENGEST